MGKGSKSLIYYVAMLLVFGALMYLITKGGEALEIKDAISLSMDAPNNLAEGFEVFKNLLLLHIESPIGILLLQIILTAQPIISPLF